MSQSDDAAARPVMPEKGSDWSALHARERGDFEAVAPLAASLFGADEARLPKNAQMLGDGGPADLRKCVRNGAGGDRRLISQQGDDVAPRRVAERREGVRLLRQLRAAR